MNLNTQSTKVNPLDRRGDAVDVHAVLKEHADRISALEKQGVLLVGQTTQMQVSLAENTASTKNIEQKTNDVFEILNSWRGAMKTLEGFGKILRPFGWIAAALASIATLYFTIKSGLSK